jgi:sulfite reductase alpha subunit-like flavoprotein
MVGRLLGSLAPIVMSMDEAAGRDLSKESFVLIVTSTHRDGEVPTNGQAFHRALTRLPAGDLSGVRFAVLGIGNRIYSNFCAAAVAFDTALAAAGADRAVAMTLADEIAGQADTVKEWIELMSSLLGTEVRRSDPALRRPSVEVASPKRGADVAPATNATIVSNLELLVSPEPDRSTREIVLELDADAGRPAPYRPGDHLAVMPVNPPEEVARIRRHLGLQADSWFLIREADGPLSRFRDAYSLDRLLGHDLDLAFPEAPEELLSALRDAAKNPADRDVLDRWIALLDLESSDSARQNHKEWLRGNFATLADLLDNFPDCVPSLDVLVEIVPSLRPRLFSIASSPLEDPDRVRLIVGSLQYRGAEGQLRQGVASRYLCSLAAGERLNVAVKPAHRQLPPDFDGPLLLIGAGTGLSQLFGVLEDRALRSLRSTPARPVRLFFGCRNEAEFLMRDRLLAWRGDGVLESVTVALSRETPTKAYVQDALDAEADDVFALLGTPETRVMVCGDARMAAEVADRILQILQREGRVPYTDAMKRLRELRDSGRYMEDVWGVQLNRDVALPEILRERYDQGGGWVRRLGRKLGTSRRATPAIRRY